VVVYEGSVPRRRTKRLFGDSRRQVFFGLTTLSPVGRTPGPTVVAVKAGVCDVQECSHNP
jgi:hypothetical protein